MAILLAFVGAYPTSLRWSDCSAYIDLAVDEMTPTEKHQQDVRATVADEIALTKRLRAKGKEYRDVFVEKSITRGIPYQIRGMRKKKGWTQKELAKKSGKKQSVISQLEDPDYGRVSIQTLLTLASAFDVALVVRFASFAETIKRTVNLSVDDVEISGFEDDASAIDQVLKIKNLLQQHRVPEAIAKLDKLYKELAKK